MNQNNLDILKEEMGILSDKISQIVGNLWKVRQFSFGLWVAAVGVSLGALSGTQGPILDLLLATHLIPIPFFWIDTRYQRWYRRFSQREDEISKFLNTPEYRLPRTGECFDVEAGLADTPPKFPVFDPSGVLTFGNDPLFAWNTSLLRSLCDPIPLAVYGTQLLGSAVLFAIRSEATFPWFLVFICFAVVVILMVSGPLSKRLNNSHIVKYAKKGDDE